MVLGIIVLRRVVDEELERFGGRVVLDLGIGTQQLGSIEPVLGGIHHVGCLRLQRNSYADVGIDTGCQAVSTLGLNEDDTSSTLGTIEGSGILHDCHLLDILRIDIEQQVGVIAIVKRSTGLLHVLHHTIDDNQGLGIGIE